MISFLVFPNPAHDKLYIRSANDWTEGLRIRIIDMSGRTVYLSDIKRIKIEQTLELDVAQFKPGEYYLQIGQDMDIKNFSFTKL